MDVSETHFAGTVLLNSLACLDGIAHKKTSGEEASAGPDRRSLPHTANIRHHQLLRSLERNDWAIQFVPISVTGKAANSTLGGRKFLANKPQQLNIK